MMDRSRLEKAETIFQVLVETPVERRSSVLWERCNGDAELSDLVQQLLRHDESGMAGFLCTPAGATSSRAARAEENLAPPWIGDFQIIRRLSEGGMGVVYEARQSNPPRTVALKVIRGGRFVDHHSVKLFQREVQALARLRHPGIGAIYEAGQTDEGQHFFAMEYVEGRPLLDHVRIGRLNLRQTLELFRRICDAIHYAHQRGVMHRDLKPSNILVDRDANPRILDFGLARITDTELGFDESRTAAGRIQGTLSYMSPEQARGDSEEIDIRSDVYSLGVILYELLTDRPPYDVAGLPLPEAVTVIAQQSPKKPMRLARDATGLGSLSRDMETIALKALEKQPQRRYTSAAALSDDIQRLLANQPILARPASTLYQLRKLVARHKGPSAFVTALAVLVIAFGVWMNVLYRVQRGERQRAESAEAKALAAGHALEVERDEARHARDAEAEHRRLAEQQRNRAQAVTDFLVDTLGLADPDVTQMPDVTMKDMLARAAAEAGRRFEDQPESEARVRTVIGRAYATLGELDPARANLERAVALHEQVLGTDPGEFYELLWSYVQVLEDQSDFTWRRRWRQLWRLLPEVVRRSKPELAETMVQLSGYMGEDYDAQQAGPLRAQLLERAASMLGSDDKVWLVLADFFFVAAGNLAVGGPTGPGCEYLADALAIERRTLPDTNTRVVRTLGALINCSVQNGDFPAAERLTRDSLEILKRVLPQDHWYVAVFRGRLGASLIGQRRFEDAERLLLDSLRQVTTARGQFIVYRREILQHLALLYDTWGRQEQAAQQRNALAAILAGSDRTSGVRWVLVAFGPTYPEIATAIQRMARSVNQRSGDVAEPAQDLVDVRRRLLPDDHVLAALVAELLHDWATVISNRTGFDQTTLVMNREADRIARAADHLNSWKRAGTGFNLGWNLEVLGAHAEGEPFVRDAVQILERQFGNRDYFLSNARSLLGMCLVGRERFDEAEPLLVQSYEELLAGPGATNQNTVNALNRVVKMYAGWQRPIQAIPRLAAFSTKRAVFWSWIRPVVEPLHPQLAETIERLSTAPPGDRAELVARIEKLRAARAALKPENPVTRLYADAVFRVVSASWCPQDPVWTPIVRDIVDIERRYDAKSPKMHVLLWRLTTLELERGDYAAAELPAREGLAIVYAKNLGRGHQGSRKSALGAALAGQGQFAQAEELLRPSYPPRSEKDITSTLCFGYLIDLYGATSRPEAALGFAEPVMRRALAARNDASHLDTLAWTVARRPGLGRPLYALALELARAASELVPKDDNKLRTLGAAYFRNGQYDAALAALTRADELNHNCDPSDAAFLAMTHKRLGQLEPARRELARLRRQLDEQGPWASEQIRSLLRETQQVCE